MKCISSNCRTCIDENVWSDAEKNFSIQIREDIKEFMKENSGGFPNRNFVKVNSEEYEVRVFLSLDENDLNYFIKRPLNFFLEKTKGRIVPIGIDSGDNYYCVNNENGKVYYWNCESDRYFCLSKSLYQFTLLFE